jgi:hypothetical protein
VKTKLVKEIALTLEPFHIDCAITVALKIADDSCKMDKEGRALFMMLYDALPEKKSSYFDNTVFELIDMGRHEANATIADEIRPLREEAMQMITRPHMKDFKTMVRRRLRELQLNKKG